MSETAIDITNPAADFTPCPGCGLTNPTATHICAGSPFDCCASPEPIATTDCRAHYRYYRTNPGHEYVWTLSFTADHDAAYFQCANCGTELDLDGESHDFIN